MPTIVKCLRRTGVARPKFVLWLIFLLATSTNALDLTKAVLLVPAGLSRTESNAISILLQEVEKRSGVRWVGANTWPASNAIVVAVGPKSGLSKCAGPYAGELTASAPLFTSAEGFRVVTRSGPDHPSVFVSGNDARGVLFGVGRFLRELHMAPGSVSLPDSLDIRGSPAYSLRGHQLGYRPKCNSYDAWDLPTWEQYIRDLAVFGCNAIELIPPRSDDDETSPHFPRPPMEMMVGMSQIADQYGLDVWIWYPAMDKDYANPKTVESALKEWGNVFAQLPRIDAVFVPGGDPGHTRPKYLLDLLEQQTRNLHRFHPAAQMWVSPQSFNQVWLDEFIEILRRDKPSWLTGIVHGPQVRVSIPKLRELVPTQYPIRQYPDITHSRQCQYPVPDWDTAFAVTEARECINPRPLGEAVIFRKTQPGTIGFLTYSEGCNDDVNKFVWSALGWNPDADVTEVLREYSRYFIGEEYADTFAQGLLALERNWQGPLLANRTVETTLAQFQSLERAARPATLRNWRFQQALFRAYYDAYTRHRLIRESELENRTMEALGNARGLGALAAVGNAESILARADSRNSDQALRTRIFRLAEALFQSIGMQLSVDKYQAIAVDRGASLDTLDFPLNNRPWLTERFARIRSLPSEPDRLDALDQIINWTNPGPGGFYDDLGNISQQPHLVTTTFSEDPARLQSPRVGFEEDLVTDDPSEKAGGARRVSWIDHAESLYDAPLQVRYTGLDTNAAYQVRVLYGGDNPNRKIRLTANDTLQIHDFIPKPVPFKPLEFAIPPSATASGTLSLTWLGEPGLGGNGRGCQVSEVWLMKTPGNKRALQE